MSCDQGTRWSEQLLTLRVATVTSTSPASVINKRPSSRTRPGLPVEPDDSAEAYFSSHRFPFRDMSDTLPSHSLSKLHPMHTEEHFGFGEEEKGRFKQM